MSVLGLLTAAALLAPTVAQVAPQETPEQASAVPTYPSSDVPLRPAEVVASRVRDVLKNHDSDEAWQELAVALPELALSGDADIEATFAAARVAEEMTPAPTSNEPGRAALELMRKVDGALLGQLFAVVFGLFAVSMLLKSTGIGTRSVRVEPTAVRCREARALASDGVPVYEISRRTGLARDAVSVLLSRSAP